MKFFLQRAKDNIGQLYVDDNPVCLIIENPELKIPAGIYEVALLYSPKFQRINPHLLNVPGQKGIEIHTANYYGDLEGCLGPGTDQMPGEQNPKYPGQSWVRGSTAAYRVIMACIRDYIFTDVMAKYEPITITIKEA